MKIYYIAKFKKLWDEESIARTFESLGHTVIRREQYGMTNDQFIADIDEQKPDIVMWAKLETLESNTELAYRINRQGYKTVCWLFDIYFGYPGRASIVNGDGCFQARYVFTSDGGHDELWERRHINHTTLRQGIYEPYAFLGKRIKEYPFDVVFVGGLDYATTYRQILFKKLDRWYGEKFHWYGIDDTDEVRGKKLNSLYASAKVVVGDSFFSPNYWSNRIYETLGRGGFLIHPDVPGLEKEFAYYKHLVPYPVGNFDLLRDKIDYFLKNPGERDLIRMAGYEHCKKVHNLKNRCKTLLDTL